MEIISVIIGFIVAKIVTEMLDGDGGVFFLIWTISTVLIAISIAVFSTLLGLIIPLVVVVLFIWMVRKIVKG